MYKIEKRAKMANNENDYKIEISKLSNIKEFVKYIKINFDY